ncbi:MAG: hypothetical protein H0V34_08525 [Gammaproteobacteria bacterium]|nr:hypothetical protein [Gammaproteobacteria bacterium]
MLKWVTALITISLGACAVGPDYRRPALDLPAQWNDEVLLTARERAELSGWWGYFEDPEIARVRETRARLGFAQAEQFPTVDLQIDAARERVSEIRGAQDRGAGGFGTPSGGTFNLFSIAGALDYEVDLWAGWTASRNRRADRCSSRFSRATRSG